MIQAVAVVVTAVCCVCCTSALYTTYKGCDVVVKISSGPICGSLRLAEKHTKYYAFRGIPYAKPPTRDRRFAELEECDPWEETLVTIEEGPVCPQLDIVYGSIPVQAKGMLEDCIYANVYVPTTAKLNSSECDGKGLPILVNVHGGGFQIGSGNADLHGPEYLMHKRKVIMMSINYRLGVFGFLSLGSDKIPGNNGLRDIVFFLKWVQKNAAAFGGNPRDVTLLGQSAGASLVHLLTLSKAAEGLFQRVIMLSGTAIPTFYSASRTYAKYLADLFLNAADITATDPDVIHQQLIEMPLDKIMYASSIVLYNIGVTSFAPVVEYDHPNFTKILDDEPLNLIAQRRGCHIPMIVGFTNNETMFFRRALLFLDTLTRVNQDQRFVLSPRLVFELSPADAMDRARLVMERYSNGTLTMDNLVNLESDTLFVYPAIKLAQFRSAMCCAPVYLYEYSYESMFSMIKRAVWEQYSGAAHVEDLTYIYRTNTLRGDQVSFPPTNNDDYMIDWMTHFVINFIRCNNPTCRDDAGSKWRPVNHTLLLLQSIAEPRVLNMTEPSEYHKSMVNFFDTIDPDVKAISDSLNIQPFE